jgi:hypothetical protein
MTGPTTDEPTAADADGDPGGAPVGDDEVADPHADALDEPDDWYRWGRAVLYAEMLLAVLVTCFSLSLAFTGTAGFLT